MKITKYCFPILLSFFGCDYSSTIELSELDIDSSSEPVISIEGSITTINSFHEVRINQHSFVQGKVIESPIKNARVNIRSQNSNFNFVAEQDHILADSLYPDEGLYISENKIHGKVGEVYEMTVEINGTVYSAIDTLTEGQKFTFQEAGFPTFDTNGNSLTFLPHYFGFYKPMGFRMDGLVPDTATYKDEFNVNPNIWHYAHPGISPNGIDNDFPFYTGIISEYVGLLSFSISHSYYQYLVAIFNETDWKSGFFPNQPGNAKTNFSSGATGFFFASDVQITFAKRDEMEQIAKDNTKFLR